MIPKDKLSLAEASAYLAMDPGALSALAAERRIPALEGEEGWVFSKKSIDKWRARQEGRGVRPA